MSDVFPLEAIAAYRRAAMTSMNSQGIYRQAQSQLRTIGMEQQQGGPQPPPHGINGSIPQPGPHKAFYSEDRDGPTNSFSDLIKGGVESVIESNRHAEYISMQAIAGRADVTEVVTAIAHAQETLSTLVTVRDRMISAYQEILRMPI